MRSGIATSASAGFRPRRSRNDAVMEGRGAAESAERRGTANLSTPVPVHPPVMGHVLVPRCLLRGRRALLQAAAARTRTRFRG